MIAKIYRPENLVEVSTGRNQIIERECVSSAHNDEQSRMKQRVYEAAIREGLNKDTIIIGLADGAKNCWNIIKHLTSFCTVFLCILDWFHIGKNMQNLLGTLSNKFESHLSEIKKHLW